MEANNKAMREALKQLKELNDLWFDTFTLPDGATSIHDEIENVISAALAEPVKNCEVGTAEEQFSRHDKYCNNQPDCKLCLSPMAANNCIRCCLAWLQMPYEEGVPNAE